MKIVHARILDDPNNLGIRLRGTEPTSDCIALQKYRRAAVSLMIATLGAPALSRGSKSRPRITRMPTVAKYLRPTRFCWNMIRSPGLR